MSQDREYSARLLAVGSIFCPSCGGIMERESLNCPICGFTGSKTMDLFGTRPPMLQPVLDAAGVWSAQDQREIKRAVSRFNQRFPQIRWRICVVALGKEVSQPLFGFWLLNASPLAEGETEEDRTWTVLLIVDSEKQTASVTPGYRAEPWLSDDMWEGSLNETKVHFRNGKPGLAVAAFLDSARTFFEKAWDRAQIQLPVSNRQ
jgi:hypothetical protein